jgi:hypothetical protein
MHILFAFLTAAVVMTGALTSINDRNEAQEAQLSSWSFFLNRLETKVKGNKGSATSPSVAKAPVIVPEKDTFTMEWNIPSTRLDGSSLSTADISGYELYYTSTTQGVNEVIKVDDPSQTTYEFADIAPGTYLIAIASIDSVGVRSPSSSTIEVIVN